MKKILILIAFCIAVSGCYSAPGKLNTFAMPHPPKTGPVEYRTGWTDGCKTGMTTYSNAHLRTQYQTTVNAESMKHTHYQKGWEVGQSYCSYYISSYFSNTEIIKNDVRSDNTWLSVQSDGFFSYEGFDKLDAGFSEASDLPFLSGNRNSLASQDWTFFN